MLIKMIANVRHSRFKICCTRVRSDEAYGIKNARNDAQRFLARFKKNYELKCAGINFKNSLRGLSFSNSP